MSLWVRCRDGAFYLHPRFVLAQGYVIFDVGEPPELVVWQCEGDPVDPVAFLRFVFGPEGFDPNSIDQPRAGLRLYVLECLVVTYRKHSLRL